MKMMGLGCGVAGCKLAGGVGMRGNSWDDLSLQYPARAAHPYTFIIPSSTLAFFFFLLEHPLGIRLLQQTY